MTMSRREFFLATSGAAAGFILPSFYEKVLEFTESFGEPLLDLPRNPKIVLTAADWAGDGDYELNWGTPAEEPPEMTIREFALRYWGSEKDYLEAWYIGEDIDFDAKANWYDVVDCWCRKDSANAKAYRLLEGLDLGASLSGADAVGEVEFIDGPCPGNDYLGVQAAGLVSLSLLQQRLNDLGTGISIEMGEC